MRFGYPGDNLHLENHGVSEESFWPSFTDIMMVIVMVFLLVTVSVILNNWTLISDLKESISAQKVAATLVESQQEENQDLSTKLQTLSAQLSTANNDNKTEKQKLSEALLATTILNKKLEDLTLMLNSSANENNKKEKEIIVLTKKVEDKSASLLAAKELVDKLTSSLKDESTERVRLADELAMKSTELSTSETKVTALNESLISISKERDTQSTEVETLKKNVTEFQSILAALQTDRGSTADKLIKLQEELSLANKVLEEENNKDAQIADKNQALQIQNTEQSKLIAKLEEEKELLSGDLADKVAQTEKELVELKVQTEELSIQLASKDTAITALQEIRTMTETQLLSLKGKYDSLDGKYQKLLQPARSSKGKFIVSVVYKKTGRSRTIRVKTRPNGSYKTVKKDQLYKILEALKQKHKTDLYLKVIIPEKSGLSYNEAWKFTSNLQKRFDYYFQR